MRTAICIALSLLALPAAGETTPAPARRAELRHLLEQDCGSCHGLTLRGGLGPSLLPQALSGKPKEFLVATILYGRPGTAMPPWGPLLSPLEAQFLVDVMLSGEGR